MRLPRPSAGNDPLVQKINEIIACLAERTILDHPSVAIDRTVGGFRVKVPESSGGQAPGQVTGYLLHSVQDDFLLCKPFLSPGIPDENIDSLVPIAKPHGLRKKGWDNAAALDPAPPVDGITYLWPDVNDSTARTADQGGVTESQRVTPYFVTSFSIIYATEVEGLDLQWESEPDAFQDITLLDINADARAWAKV